MEDKLLNGLKDALEIEDRDLNLNDNFRDYKEWDSLAQLTVIAMLDEQFQVSIESNEFEKLKTNGDLLEAIKARTNS